MILIALVDISVTVDGIKSKLPKLKKDKAAGTDNMSPRILKALCEEIAVPLTIIFRKSLDTGCVPGDWSCQCFTSVQKG